MPAFVPNGQHRAAIYVADLGGHKVKAGVEGYPPVKVTARRDGERFGKEACGVFASFRTSTGP
jgi:hypothetical protein